MPMDKIKEYTDDLKIQLMQI